MPFRLALSILRIYAWFRLLRKVYEVLFFTTWRDNRNQILKIYKISLGKKCPQEHDVTYVN